jgi:hypothetical protein
LRFSRRESVLSRRLREPLRSFDNDGAVVVLASTTDQESPPPLSCLPRGRPVTRLLVERGSKRFGGASARELAGNALAAAAGRGPNALAEDKSELVANRSSSSSFPLCVGTHLADGST